MLSWFKGKPKRPIYFAEVLTLTYTDVHRAKHWWLQVFGCNQAKMPDWDDVQPDDLALQFEGAEQPTICLRAAGPGFEGKNERQLVWTGTLDDARQDLIERGASPGLVKEGRVRSFDLRDPEENLIEVCEE